MDPLSPSERELLGIMRGFSLEQLGYFFSLCRKEAFIEGLSHCLRFPTSARTAQQPHQEYPASLDSP